MNPYLCTLVQGSAKIIQSLVLGPLARVRRSGFLAFNIFPFLQGPLALRPARSWARLDPANKYLSHSFVESPDMMNIYNGNVITDARGFATVLMPDYFTALNRDFRYQLTVIGRFAQAIVARKIKNNRFVIRTSKPHTEVSWQVTGIRQDAFANAHRVKVEEEKSGAERGRYLYPKLFGQPEEGGVEWTRKPGHVPQKGETEKTEQRTEKDR